MANVRKKPPIAEEYVDLTVQIVELSGKEADIPEAGSVLVIRIRKLTIIKVAKWVAASLPVAA